ncbi:hypothetical protein ACFYMW_10350 [Streptomyces sp. NPDC006692]
MSSKIRRAAGTQSPSDVLIRRLWIKRPSAAKDAEDYAAGTTLKVTCFSRTVAGASGRRQLGYLHLTHGQPITWHRAGSQPVLLRAPFVLTPSEVSSGHRKLAAFDLNTADGPRDLAIPKADRDPVERALKSAEA